MATPKIIVRHGATSYPAGESPANLAVGDVITATTDTGAIGQWKLEDADDRSALATGSLGGPAAISPTVTLDAPGGYMLGLYDAATGARIARLAFSVPEAWGDLIPPYDATGDVVLEDGSTQLGDYRPSGIARWIARGWKAVAAILARAAQLPPAASAIDKGIPIWSAAAGRYAHSVALTTPLVVDVTAGNVDLTVAQALATRSIVVVGTAGVPRLITVSSVGASALRGVVFEVANESDNSVDVLNGGNGISLRTGEVGSVEYNAAISGFQIVALWVGAEAHRGGVVTPDGTATHFLDGNGAFSPLPAPGSATRGGVTQAEVVPLAWPWVPVAMADANQTPAAPDNTCAVIVCTGALTADRLLILPLVRRVVLVINSTTGGHNINVIGNTGTGALVAAGPPGVVFCDGVNFTLTP